MRLSLFALAAALFALSSCDDSDKGEPIARKVADCSLISNRVFGTLAISGQPGDDVSLEATCGGTVVVNCLASIPQGRNVDSCVLGPVPVNQARGAYFCGPVVKNGAPTGVVHDCKIVP